MPEEAKWYVVHTYSGYENKVASNLEKTVENRHIQDLIQEIRVPTEIFAAVQDLLVHLQSQFRFPMRKLPDLALKRKRLRFPTALVILSTLLMVRSTDLPVLLKKLTSRKTVSV